MISATSEGTVKPYLIAALAATILAGCAIGPTEKWENPKYAGNPNAADIGILELEECNAYASGRAPRHAGPIFMPAPQPTSYTTTGSYQRYGNIGGSYTATTTANNTAATSFATGFNTGSALGAAIMQAHAEKRMHTISAACMRMKGWIDVSTEEGKTRFQQVASSDSKNRADIASSNTAQTQEQLAKSEAAEWSQAVQALASEIKGQEGAPDYTRDAKMAEELGKKVEELMIERGLNPTRQLVPMQGKLELLRQAHRMLMQATLHPPSKQTS